MSCERVDTQCCRCGQEIDYTGDVLDVFENNLICSDCWELKDDEVVKWFNFEYRQAPYERIGWRLV